MKAQRIKPSGKKQKKAKVEADDVVVEERVLGGVELRGGAFPGKGEADGVRDALPERAGGGLDAWGFMILGVSRGDGMELAEGCDIVLGNGVTGKVQPAVEEHRAVACGKDEAVAVEPAGGVRVEIHAFAEKDGTDFGAAERQAEVAGIAGVDGVHGETAGLGCGGG